MKIIENYYDIVILPPTQVSNYCIKLSKQIDNRFGSKFSLGKTENLPHISLLHTAFSKENFKFLKNKLLPIAKNTKPFEVKIKNFLNYPEHGSVTLEVIPKASFLTLYEEVVVATKNLIDTSFDCHAVWNSDKASSKIKKYIDEYTSPMVKEYFIPHITLNTLKNKDDLLNLEKEIRVKPRNFIVNELTVCTLTKFHTCQDVIFRILLE